MSNFWRTPFFLSCVTLCGLNACVSRNDIDAMREQQQTILTKLDAINQKLEAPPRAPQPSMPQGPSQDAVYAFPVGTSAVKGKADALVTVIEVSDFQCPFCSRAADTLREVEKKFKSDVRFVFKHNPLPFHARALPAAIAAECAGRHGNQFWAMHDLIFAQQSKLEDTHFEEHAKKLKLPLAAWKRCLDDPEIKKSISEDQVTANALGARGTPAFFINGRFLSGAQPFPSFEALIKTELARAKASGVPAKEYYAQEIVKKGKTSL